MKISLKLLLAAVFVFCPLLANAQAEPEYYFSYSSSEKHYSFKLPFGWKQIPKEKIDETMSLVSDKTGASKINYVVGFQMEAKSNFQYPYFLVTEHGFPSPAYSEINRELNRAPKTIEKMVDNYSEFITSTNVEEPFLDKAKNIVFVKGVSEIPNVGSIKMLTAIFLGKEDSIQLSFYSKESEFLSGLPQFDAIINSFEFEPGYEYDPNNVKGIDWGGLFDGTGEAFARGLLSGGLFAVVIAFLSTIGLLKRRKKNIVSSNASEPRAKRYLHFLYFKKNPILIETFNALDELSLFFSKTAGTEFPNIIRKIKKIIKSDKSNFLNSVKSRDDIEKFIYNSVAKYATWYIESGNYHIYRGYMDPRGEELFSAFKFCINKLVEKGMLTKAQGSSEIKSAEGVIKSMG